MASNRSDVVHGGMVLVPEKIPYMGKGIDALLIFLRQVLDENKYTQKILVEVGKPIYIEKLVPKEEAPELSTLGYLEAARSKTMDEYGKEGEQFGPSGKRTTYEQLFDMFCIMSHENFEVCHILTGNLKKLALAVGLRTERLSRLYGVPVSQVDIPSDTVIFCGAVSRDATPEEVEFSLKAVLV